MAQLPALRLITCGSVDDGKSTLIGRLLFEQKAVAGDHLEALARDSRRYGTVDGDVDYALLLDGLEAEWEQGITIDVAYRYFATARRSFVIADTPGHAQYTRNMVTAASNAELAILLVDARKGLLAQTDRHAVLVSLLGIRDVVLAVNKIDLVDFDRAIFDNIVADFRGFAADLNFRSITAIPLSARDGDNVSTRSERTPWYDGPPLISFLEAIDTGSDLNEAPFRMPVQSVSRPSADFRGVCGMIAGGDVKAGDEVTVLPSGRATTVKSVMTPGEGGKAMAGDSVTLTFTDDIDISRGDMLVAPRARAQVADQFAAHIVWLGNEPLFPGRSYLMKINHLTLPATVTELKHRIDIATQAKLAAKTLDLNDIGFGNLSVSRPVAFDPYAENRNTGGFILIDRASNETVAAGMIDFALRRATNIHHHHHTVGKASRAALTHHKPAVLWFTGLSASGKSTIANLVEVSLHARGVHTMLLDGDNVRHGLNRDLGFSEVDRVENIRRVAEVARLMTEAGLIVLCSFISPFAAERQLARDLVEAGEFIEIFVDAPLEDCIARDPKGLYARALAGEITNFTGIGQPYERPERPELHLPTRNGDAAALAQQVIDTLIARKIL